METRIQGNDLRWFPSTGKLIVYPRNDKHKTSSYFLQLTGAENRQTYQILGPNIQRNVQHLIRENDPLDSKFASHRSRKISKQTDHV